MELKGIQKIVITYSSSIPNVRTYGIPLGNTKKFHREFPYNFFLHLIGIPVKFQLEFLIKLISFCTEFKISKCSFTAQIEWHIVLEMVAIQHIVSLKFVSIVK